MSQITVLDYTRKFCKLIFLLSMFNIKLWRAPGKCSLCLSKAAKSSKNVLNFLFRSLVLAGKLKLHKCMIFVMVLEISPDDWQNITQYHNSIGFSFLHSEVKKKPNGGGKTTTFDIKGNVLISFVFSSAFSGDPKEYLATNCLLMKQNSSKFMYSRIFKDFLQADDTKMHNFSTRRSILFSFCAAFAKTFS